MSVERVDLERVNSSESVAARPDYPRALGYPSGYPYGNPYSDGGDGAGFLNPRAVWRIVRKRKGLIMIIAAVVTTLVTLQMYRSKNIYQAATTIEVGKDNPTLLRTGDSVIEYDNFFDSFLAAQALKSKIRILQSRPVLEDVVVSLKLDQNPRFMEATQTRTIWDGLKALGSRFTRKEQDEQPEQPPRPPVNVEGLTPRSPAESARLAPYVGVLAASMTADPIEDTSMLAISYSHTDASIASDVANTIAEVFIQRSFENKTAKFTNTSAWLDRSTRDLKAKVQRAEQDLADYSKTHNIFSTDGKETLTTEKLKHLHDQATKLETDRMLLESLYHEVRQGKIQQLPEAFADPKTAALQVKLGELAVQKAEFDVKLGPENPKVIEVQEKMNAIQQQISENRKTLEEKLRADYERALRDEQSVKTALEGSKSEAVQQNQDAIQYSILKQEVDTAKSLYTDFLQKTNQAKVQVAEQRPSIRVIEPAVVPTTPVGPRRVRAIMIGLFLSLIAGTGLAFAIEHFDNTIKSVEDVNRYAQLPALGVIPSTVSNRRRLISSGSRREKIASSSQAAPLDSLISLDARSSIAEAYRVLRTSVLLSTAGHAPKTILVTSSQPGEGKTTTTINTAISLAQLGARVLIIDCDLRKPTAHKVLQVEHSRGLSTYLSRDVSIDEIIQPLPIPNLSIMPCGPIPPNPAELISSERMRGLLRALGERYDHILIDSPPLINVTDPVILSTLVDGVILVVHGGRSTRDVVRRARQELATVGARIFGVVLNNVDLRRDGYDDYYYYRHYSNYEAEDVVEV
jgi:polysaccharide biosynthesis transport protein